MAMLKFRAPVLPTPPHEYSVQYMDEFIRALDQYFSHLDSTTPIVADSFTEPLPVEAVTVGYRGAPFTDSGAGHTFALADAGQMIGCTSGAFAIPANATVAFPVGTMIALFNNAATTRSVTITSDTLRLSGTTSTGTRTMDVYSVATIVKVDTTTWVVSGAGLT